MKVKTDYNKCPYITAGKIYSVCKDKIYNCNVIFGDNGEKLLIVAPRHNAPCPHLDMVGFWEEVK